MAVVSERQRVTAAQLPHDHDAPQCLLGPRFSQAAAPNGALGADLLVTAGGTMSPSM